MVTRFQLEDLYTRGKDFSVPGKDGEILELHLRKLNPQQQQRAVRAANAARIRMMQVLNRDPETDDDRLILEDRLTEMGGRQDLIDFLVKVEASLRHQAVEQEIASEEEWAKEGRIQALYDAWTVEMQAEYAKGPEQRSTESQELFDQLEEFAERVSARVKVLSDAYADELDELQDEEIRSKAMKVLLDRDAGTIWLKTYRDYQILYGVEDKETGDKLYTSIDQVLEVPPVLYGYYLDTINSSEIPTTDLK